MKEHMDTQKQTNNSVMRELRDILKQTNNSVKNAPKSKKEKSGPT